MSLQVWLPLTKDLRQQGVSSAIATNNGAVYSSTGGKLGGCYTFTNYNIAVPATSFRSEFTGTGSLACWVKVSTSHNTWAQCLTFGTAGTSWNNILFGIDINSSGQPVANTSNGSSYTNCNANVAIKDNAWHHLAATFGDGKTTIYVDGVQKNQVTTSNIPAWSSVTNLFIGGNSSEVFKNGEGMNDIRLYNHCLSSMEVKQISQGLVLHYPLNRGGFGQDNYILESHSVTGGGNASGITRTYETDGSMKIVSVSGNGNYASLAFAKNSNTSVGNNMSVGDIYCISCDIKVEVGTVLPTLFINSGNGYKQLNLINNSIIIGKWMRAYYTSTWAEPGTQYGNISLHLGFSGAIGTYYFKNFKLEKGSIPTPWCPNIEDTNNMGINSTTEYDCAGFCNNGTKNGTYSYTSDTPKYAVSQNCLGTNYISLAPPSTEVQTIAIWVNWTTIPSGQSVIFVDYGSGMGLGLMSTGILCSTSSAGNSYTFSKANLVANTWYHFVVVKTGTTTRKLYINGVEQTATSNTSNWTYAVNELQLGKRSTTSDGFVGKLSDFRCYATALSADDVKSLYQNCATIDPDGTIRGQIRS